MPAQFYNPRPAVTIPPVQSTPVPRFHPGFNSGTNQRLADLQQAGVTMQRIVATTGKLVPGHLEVSLVLSQIETSILLKLKFCFLKFYCYHRNVFKTSTHNDQLIKLWPGFYWHFVSFVDCDFFSCLMISWLIPPLIYFQFAMFLNKGINVWWRGFQLVV